MADVLDVLIVGGGAAGYTAGFFAARDGCRALLLEKFSSGGQVLDCEHITNFPGFPQGVAGFAKAGGSILVCSPCFKKRKPDESSLVTGATIAGGAKRVEFLSDRSPCVSY
jgi:hypothetical protein